MSREGDKLYIVLISVHGLIRGHNMELGRDADTGGQTLYVVELARALAEHPDVERVDLLTRRVRDHKVDSDYAEPVEVLAPGANIIRLDCGPRRYLRKEVLWPHLQDFTDKALHHIRSVGRLPDIVHGHYADAGLVASRLACLLGIPMAFTGHSLGRVKRQRLLEKGQTEERIESQYNLSQRIEAEERALDTAALVIASTRQEVDEQYVMYDNYQPNRMVVIPPGVDISRFYPPRRTQPIPRIREELSRFLVKPEKPMILALSRADERKNIATLVRAYAENEELQEVANLVIVAGNRDDINNMERGPRDVLQQLLLLIDRYDLYGKVAYPKHHSASDVPYFYRLAAKTKGIFVNPALTEPFGLTLIEAAASGLPVVATEDGGPGDILHYCKNGQLIDPLDADTMGQVLLEALTDRHRWRNWSNSGLRGAHRYFSWPGHADNYLRAVRKVFTKRRRGRLTPMGKSHLPTVDRIAVSSIDGSLIGDEPGLRALRDRLRYAGSKLGMCVATARNLEAALKVLRQWNMPMPDLLITSMGSEIYYGHDGLNLVKDNSWQSHIDHQWDPDALRQALSEIPGIRLQSKSRQRQFKISYIFDPAVIPKLRDIQRHLRQLDLHANLIFSHQRYLDVLPIRVSKGQAIRFIAIKWGLPLERFLVVGDSGNDEEMLLGDTLAVVVGNHSQELEKLRGKPRILFAEGSHAWGILEGIEYYNFLGDIRVPEEEPDEVEYAVG